jgi:hypothetical protein
MIDPKNFPQASEKVEEENWLFRSFLKGQDSEEIDETVHYLHEKLFEQIDCVACSNCCKNTSTGLENEDIKRISKYLGVNDKEFINKYLTKNKSGRWVLDSRPCKFLTANGCSIYEVRPRACREYPHTNKPEFISRSIIMIENASVCPVVFEILEKLKSKYSEGFKDYLSFMPDNW